MRILVISDLHIGRGKFLRDGSENLQEDFDQDEKFVEFLNYYAAHEEDIHLILNGDILNLLDFDLLDLKKQEGITEEMVVEALHKIFKEHKEVFQALKNFLNQKGKKATYIVGNHDLGMLYPQAQKIFQDYLKAFISFTDHFYQDGFYVEHGQRFEEINHTDFNDYLTTNSQGKFILNLPWASVYCLYLLPEFKEKRPYMNKVRPMSSYVWWTLFYDTKFFFFMVWKSLNFIISTIFFSRYRFRGKSFDFSLFKKVTIVKSFTNMAKKVLFEEKPEASVVVLGHTHIFEWRRFKEGKYYFNSGCWNVLYSMNVSMQQNIYGNYYVSSKIEDGKLKNVKIKRWRGSWQPYTDEVKELFQSDRDDSKVMTGYLK